MVNKSNENLKLKLQKYSNYILVFFLIMFSLSMLKNISKTRKALTNINEKEAKVNNLKQENVELEKKIAEMRSPEYIERQIRNNLGLAKEGEVIIILPEDDILRKLAPQTQEEEETLPDPYWKKWIKLFI